MKTKRQQKVVESVLGNASKLRENIRMAGAVLLLKSVTVCGACASTISEEDNASHALAPSVRISCKVNQIGTYAFLGIWIIKFL